MVPTGGVTPAGRCTTPRPVGPPSGAVHARTLTRGVPPHTVPGHLAACEAARPSNRAAVSVLRHPPVSGAACRASGSGRDSVSGRSGGATTSLSASTGGVSVTVVGEAWEGDAGDRTFSGFGASTSEGRTRRRLRINNDLELWRAREARKAWKRTPDAVARKQHMEDSEALYEKVLEEDPTEGKAYVGLGKNYVLQGRVEEARELYDRGTQVTQGQNAFIWTSWAYLEASQSNFPKARQLYDAAVAADKSHAAAWHGWAQLERKQGNFVAARDLLVKGIQNTRDKPNSYLYQSVAVLAASMGLIEEARSWFQEGTETTPGAQSHAMWQAWAMLEYRQGDYQAARFLFKKCLEVNPRSRYAYLAWAQFEAEAGRMQNARKLLQRGIEYNPLDPALLQKAAVLEQVEGNFDEARKLFQKGADVSPKHLYIWQAWGVMEYMQGNIERARELFQQGVWAAPQNPDVVKVFQAWGVLEGRQGNYAFARELFKAAIKLDSQSTHTWTAWITLEEQYGALERAQELRNLQMQERVRFQVPSTFSTRPAVRPGDTLMPILSSIRDWLQQYETVEELESQRAERAARQRPRFVEAADLRGDVKMAPNSTDRVALKPDVLDDIQRREQEAGKGLDLD